MEFDLSAHFQWQDRALILHCHIQPGAKRDQVVGLHGMRIKIKLKAPPVGGRANSELLGYLAGQFGVAKNQVEISHGSSSRQKMIRIQDPQRLPDAFAIAPAN